MPEPAAIKEASRSSHGDTGSSGSDDEAVRERPSKERPSKEVPPKDAQAGEQEKGEAHIDEEEDLVTSLIGNDKEVPRCKII